MEYADILLNFPRVTLDLFTSKFTQPNCPFYLIKKMPHFVNLQSGGYRPRVSPCTTSAHFKIEPDDLKIDSKHMNMIK